MARSDRSPRIRTFTLLNRVPFGKFNRVNFRYTTVAFTLSPEPGASLCRAHSAGSGHPEQSRRVLTYPETGPYMPFLSVGS
jgi:hypothetical protein